MSRWYFIFTQWFKRDLEGRYRGSWLGMLWPLAQPLTQVAVFTLVLHGFMQIRWPALAGGSTDGNVDGALPYALNVLAGLAVFNFFAEVMGRAPTAVLSQPNLVTKVRFPLPLLPAVCVGAAMVHIGVGVAVLLLAGVAMGTVSIHGLWVPLWLLPVLFYGVGVAMLLSSLGVYVRDIGQAMPALTGLLMFMTPIFYPMAAVPDGLRDYFQMNPVAWAAESLRGMMLHGQALNLMDWSAHLVISAALALAATWVFRTLQTGFADVL